MQPGTTQMPDLRIFIVVDGALIGRRSVHGEARLFGQEHRTGMLLDRGPSEHGVFTGWQGRQLGRPVTS